jgi:hypothetical protein
MHLPLPPVSGERLAESHDWLGSIGVLAGSGVGDRRGRRRDPIIVCRSGRAG